MHVCTHVRMPGLFPDMQGVDQCDGVTCKGDTCHLDGQCVNGQCFAGQAKSDGTSCDDGLPGTLGDTCINGVCRGRTTTTPATTTTTTTVDKCLDTVCSPPDDCHEAEVCEAGICFTGAPLTDGTPCKCFLSPACARLGLDAVQHRPSGQDESIGQPLTSQAAAHVLISAPAGTDDNEHTVGDQCITGVCRGSDVCAGVTCTASDECHDVGVCLLGSCSNPVKRDGAACDDGEVGTINDRWVCPNGLDPHRFSLQIPVTSGTHIRAPH